MNQPDNTPAVQSGPNPDFICQDLLETAPLAMAIVDIDGIIHFSNRQAALLLGFKRSDELVKTSFIDLVSPEHQSRIKGLLQDKNRHSSTFDMVLSRRNEQPFTAEITLSVICEKSTTVPVCSIFFTDITKRKKAEVEKAAFERQIRAVYKMEAVGQIASGIAHDLNNNLGAISGYTDLIRKTNVQGNNRLDKYVSMIASATMHASEIITNLLTFARKTRLHTMSFDVNEIVAESVKLVEHSLDKFFIIHHELSATDSNFIGDTGQIQNAVLNLALNSRDAMPEGGTITIKTGNIQIDEFFISKRRYQIVPGYYIFISVSDTGCGMDSAVFSHLFEPFFTTKELGKGTGLGLASVYGCVKSHNGYIDVESTPGIGSTFTMYFPGRRDKKKKAVGKESPKPEKITPAKRHLLVVDDEQNVREMLCDILTWLGYSISVFRTAEEAIFYYEKNHDKVDVVIIDWYMPEMNGLECFRKMKAINPKVRALMTSGSAVFEEHEEPRKEGVAGFLQKPFVSALLSKAIADILQ